MKKTKTETTAVNLEARFDAGENVLDYFDASRATVTHGGARPGAGRKPVGKVRKSVKLTPYAIARLNAFARKRKLPDFSSAIEAVAQSLK